VEHDRRRVSGVDRVEHAGAQIERRDLPGDEARISELLQNHRIHGPHARLEVLAATPAVPIAAHDQVRHPAGLQAVAHGVEERHVGDVAVDRVVERISGDLVGGFEDGGDHHVRRGEGERRQQRPAHLRRQRDRVRPTRHHRRVPVARLRHDQLTDQRPEQRPPPDDRRADVVEGRPQHADPLGRVEDRHPQARSVGGSLLHGRLGPERLSGRRVVDPRRTPPFVVVAIHRVQPPLGEIGEQDGRVPTLEMPARRPYGRAEVARLHPRGDRQEAHERSLQR
jgi:hypothetical protein